MALSTLHLKNFKKQKSKFFENNVTPLWMFGEILGARLRMHSNLSSAGNHYIANSRRSMHFLEYIENFCCVLIFRSYWTERWPHRLALVCASFKAP